MVVKARIGAVMGVSSFGKETHPCHAPSAGARLDASCCEYTTVSLCRWRAPAAGHGCQGAPLLPPKLAVCAALGGAPALVGALAQRWGELTVPCVSGTAFGAVAGVVLGVAHAPP